MFQAIVSGVTSLSFQTKGTEGQVDFVLGHFTNEDWKTMDERLETAGEIIKSFCLAGINITMNQFNKK